MNKKQSERGAILGFVIIGAVLAVLLIAGLYFSKQQARKVATGTTDTTSLTDTTTSSTGPDSKANNDSSTSQNSSSALPGDTNSSSNSTPTSSSSAAPIASTGPTEFAVTLIGLSILAAATASYFQSSRRLVQAAHQ